MKAIDWESIWELKGPLDRPPVLDLLVKPLHKHRLKVVSSELAPLEHMIMFSCQGCDWVLVCRRVLLRHIIAGTVEWDPHVIYRGWGMSMVLPTNKLLRSITRGTETFGMPGLENCKEEG